MTMRKENKTGLNKSFSHHLLERQEMPKGFHNKIQIMPSLLFPAGGNSRHTGALSCEISLFLKKVFPSEKGSTLMVMLLLLIIN